MDSRTRTGSCAAKKGFAARAAVLSALAAAFAAAQGCVSVQAGIHFLSVQAQYSRDGFVLRDGERTYRYDSAKNLTLLELRGALTLEDHESDGVVDRVKAGDFHYDRGEPGTGPLFADADRALSQFSEYMSAEHFKRKWTSLDPAGIVENRLDRPYAR